MIVAFYKILYFIFIFISSFCNEFLLLETIMINNRRNSVDSKKYNISNRDFNFSNAIVSKIFSNKNSKYDLSKKNFKSLDNSNSNNMILMNNNNCINKLKQKNEMISSENNNYKK